MRALSALVLGLTVAACSGGAGATGSAAAPPRNRDVVTRAQIEALNVGDAYEVIQRMRRDYLVGRGSGSRQSYAVVYVDGVRKTGFDTLRSMRAANIEEIRFVSATDATTRFGTDHGGGAIEIKTRQ